MGEKENLMFCAAEIVDRAKQVKGFRRDKELAEFLGISRSTLSNWVTRNSIDFPLVLGRLNEVDYNWLLTGKGTPQKQHNVCEEGEVEILHNPKAVEAMDTRTVSLYDITAAANLKTLLTDKCQRVLGEIHIPNIPRCDGAVYVSGDSMYPILKSGDIVGFKMLNNLDSVIFGEMYLVSFMLDGDDYLAVKYVGRSDKEGCLKLISYNQHHEPMDVPMDTIGAMAIVKFSIRKNLMM